MPICGQGVKGGHWYEGEGWKLKWTYPITAREKCTKLRFSDKIFMRIQKIHIVYIIEPLEIFTSCSVELHH